MLHIFDNEEQLLAGMADFFIDHAEAAIQKTGRFSAVLSGGSSPQRLFTLLSSGTYRNRIAWNKVYFFFSDERYVPHDDPESNYRMANETLFQPLQIPSENILAVDTTASPDVAAKRYEDSIREHLGDDCAFDLILLGVGGDAHTASLFPRTAVLSEENALVKEVYVEKLKQFRITLTASLLNRAKIVTFLVYGASKAEAVQHVLRDAFSPDDYPAQLVNPTQGELHWFMDKAASELVGN